MASRPLLANESERKENLSSMVKNMVVMNNACFCLAKTTNQK
jgi:hypothetical protein